MTGLQTVGIGNAAAPSQMPGKPTSSADALVKGAWESRSLSDGTRLNLGRTDAEQGFVVRENGILPVAFKQSGTQICEDGSRRLANSINLSAIRPDAGGHTHPRGRTGDVSGLPGPEDGRLAAATGKPAYVISSRGAFRIDKSAEGFAVTQLAGAKLTATERGEIARTVAAWNQHGGSSGVRCTFVPN